MLPIFCLPTIWVISLEFCRKPYILEADDFLGACYRKAMTPKKAMDFTFSPDSLIVDKHFCGAQNDYPLIQNDYRQENYFRIIFGDTGKSCKSPRGYYRGGSYRTGAHTGDYF